MEITVKIRFSSAKEKFESFGNNRYLIYLPFEEYEGSNMAIIALLSRHLGVPAGKIKFKEINFFKDRIFEIH